MKIIGMLVAFFLLATGGGSAVLAAEVRIEMRMPEGIYFLPVTLGTKSIDFALDTGAAYVILPPGLLSGVPKVRLGTETVYLGGGVPIRVIRYKVEKFSIGGCALKNLEVSATRGVTLPWLGQTFLRKVEPYTIGGSSFRFTCPTEEVAAAAIPTQ